MKKIALLLTLLLVVGMLAACGSANNTPSDSGTTPAPTNTPTEALPTDSPTPSPTPTPDPNCYFKSDFDSAPEGLLLKDKSEDIVGAINADPKLMYLLFDQVGSGMSAIGVGQGKDGTNCLLATGRTATWNGIAITVVLYQAVTWINADQAEIVLARLDRADKLDKLIFTCVLEDELTAKLPEDYTLPKFYFSSVQLGPDKDELFIPMSEPAVSDGSIVLVYKLNPKVIRSLSSTILIIRNIGAKRLCLRSWSMHTP